VNRSKHHKPKRRHGFTLLEVILALALSFLVLFAITMAIDLHLRMLDKRQKEIEQSQLSRSVLRLIREDLHGAVQYSPVDTSALEQLLAGIDPLAADALAEQLTGESTGDLLEGEDVSTASEEVATSVAPPTRPGVYGNETSISLDVSRLPRRDQLMFGAALDATFLPSDIKTVSYYIGQAQPANNFSTGAKAEPQYGLIRREVDRAVARYAIDRGGSTDLESSAKVIAPEITQIYFSYYDGQDWVATWDSDELGRLPIAIKVVVQIGGGAGANGMNQTASTNNSTNATNLQSIALETHTMVVYLTISEAPTESEASATTSSSQSTTGTSSTSP
jgi:type II secretory pathway component PulJ